MGFRHRHLRALGDQARAAALADAHPAAHDDTIHERHIGLGELADQMVERVFLGEEILQLGVASQGSMVKETDVAAGTERAERSLPPHAAHRHRQHLRIILPRQQTCW
jgi:hypothetical protein